MDATFVALHNSAFRPLLGLVDLSSGALSEADVARWPQTAILADARHCGKHAAVALHRSSVPAPGAAIVAAALVLGAMSGHRHRPHCRDGRRCRCRAIASDSIAATAPVLASTADVGPGGRDPWREPPERCALPDTRSCTVGKWEGVEQFGSVPQLGGQGTRDFYLVESFATREEMQEIMSCVKERLDWESELDTVDAMPTFEYYPFRQGHWSDTRMRSALEGLLEERVLPYIRERYHCPSASLFEVLVRRYLPGERRSLEMHWDGHAMVTGVLGLCDPDSFQGGIYLQPDTSFSSRTFPRIEPGDLLVHSYDLLHGVHVWGSSERYSLIFWVKDSPQSVLDGTAPWYDAQGEPETADELIPLAHHYETGRYGRSKDEQEARRIYERCADMGSPIAMNNLGLLCQRKALERRKAGAEEEAEVDAREAVEYWRRAAEMGFVLSQRNLAEACAEGLGVAKNVGEARAWMRRAASQLDVKAAYRLSEFLGLRFAAASSAATPLDAVAFAGDASDLEEAAWWLERSAEAGSRDAQLTLGGLLAEGDVLPRDVVAAESWLQSAVQGGSSVALFELAKLLAGRGREEEAVKALRSIGARAVRADAEPELIWMGCPAALKQRALVAGDASVDPVTIGAIEDVDERQAALRGAIEEASLRGLSDVLFQLYLDVGKCFLDCGKLEGAEAVLDGLLDLAQDLGGDGADALRREGILRNNRAVGVLRLQRRWTEAEQELIRAYIAFERMAGEKHEVLDEVSGNLALIRMCQRQM